MEQTGSELRKECNKAVYCFPVYLYTEHIMWKAGPDELQAWIKIAGRNINNLTHREGNILMVESEEELKSLLMRVKEENEKAGLKLKLNFKNLRSWHPVLSLHGK